jgi:orotate phosphoribosyltransferase
MKDKIITDETLRNRVRVFRDRAEAGTMLVAKLKGLVGTDNVLFAIPYGGVPVAAVVGNSLNITLLTCCSFERCRYRGTQKPVSGLLTRTGKLSSTRRCSGDSG